MLQASNVGKVLALLRKTSDPLSGQLLSGRLGVSRTTVWKYVRELRRQGYRIDAEPRQGYTLVAAPDRLLPSQIAPLLTSCWIGRCIEHFEEIDSTNTRAAILAREGAPEGLAVIAEKQIQGRGRLGRSWFSPPFTNLYISFILRPPVASVTAPQLSLVAGLAVARAVEGEKAAGVAIKWPNDVLVGGQKVAGVLTETEAEADRVRWVVLGIGVNLNATRSQFPAGLRGRATSVRIATGRKVDRCCFAARLCSELEVAYERFLKRGFASLRRQWESRAYLTGRRVRVEALGARVSGRVKGVDAQGALLVETSRATERVLSGDVSVVGGWR